MLQVGLGFIERGDGKLLCHRAVAKTGDLRKDEPDPVARLSSGSKLSEDGVVDGRLGGEKAVEVVNVSHGLCSVRYPFSWISIESLSESTVARIPHGRRFSTVPGALSFRLVSSSFVGTLQKLFNFQGSTSCSSR